MACCGNNKKFGVGMMIGTIIGGLTALFLSPASGKENRGEVVRKAQQLKKMLAEHEIENKVKEIFGEATEAAKKYYAEKKNLVVAKLSELRGRVDEIDKEKYLDVVEDVIKEARKEKKFAEKALNKLKEGLTEDWEKLMS